ncbi:MAG: hypothetical protein LBB07_02345 [Bifidobacteriaceae bacterium]|jgi:hypothetical protein|nr:hypothetical protein [Bifidobacteriaceae bacterium]
MRKNLILLFVFIILFFLFSYILTFAINGSLYLSLLGSNIPIHDKLDVLADVAKNIFKNSFKGFTGVFLLIVAMLQSVAVVLMVYAKKYAGAKNVCRIGKDSGLEGFALIISFIGVGCPTCGTSIIAPLIAVFVSGVSSSALGVIGNIMLIISCLLSLFAILNLVYQIKRIPKGDAKNG